jgi:chemotaxis family two-component system response regulator Rcp1
MDSPPFHILLVDDDPADLELTRAMLERGRVPVRFQTAANGRDALAVLRREGAHAAAPRPDLILLDLGMPVMDGREFLRAIKSDARLESISVVLLTTSDHAREIVETYGLGANGYVPKPFGLDHSSELLDIVEEFWMRSEQVRREAR